MNKLRGIAFASIVCIAACISAQQAAESSGAAPQYKNPRLLNVRLSMTEDAKGRITLDVVVSDKA